MQYPRSNVLNGLRSALAAAAASPAGSDFTEQNLRDVDAAIRWLDREAARLVTNRSRREDNAKQREAYQRSSNDYV